MSDERTIAEQRTRYSLERLDEFRERISELSEVKAIPGLTVFCAGSYGRLEASEHSDIDLFFLVPDRETERQPRTCEYRLFGRIIEIAELMRFPAFSNDCQYLCIHSINDVLKHLGSARDDELNLFTLRMLMLLESRWVFGSDAYHDAVKRLIEPYYRDYPDHQSSFEPTFLLNDIARFWKTLLLNYENKRNQGGDGQQKIKAKIRNFKLKFSRMTTCFATVAAIGSFKTPVQTDHMLEIVGKTPAQRLQLVRENRLDLEEPVARLLELYAWFLEQTGLATEDLEKRFGDSESRTKMFARADEYRSEMYALLRGLDVDGGSAGRGLVQTLVI